MSPNDPTPGRPSAWARLRRLPSLGVVTFLLPVALVWIWWFKEIQRQDKYIQTAQALLAWIAFFLVWTLCFSGLRWTRRLALFFGTAGLIALLGSSLRISGVTGDLVPILRWRWSKPVERAALPTLPAAPATAAPIAPKAEAVSSNDFPQSLGPARTGVIPGVRLDPDWKSKPPVLLWRQPVGAAWSGFAVVGSKAITLEQRGEEETAVCYDLVMGKPLWTRPSAAHFNTVIAGEGPRTTPAIWKGRVYTYGATAILNCLELDTGKLVWSRNPIHPQAKVPDWGFSSSPLVYDGMVLVSGGGPSAGALVAFDAVTGEPRWSNGTEGAGYSSPVAGVIGGVPQILDFNAGGVDAHAPGDGARLWHYPWRGGHPHVAMPLILPGDQVLVSSGYGTGSELLDLARGPDGVWAAKQVWKSAALKAKFANLIVRQGFVFGLDDGMFTCLELKTGVRKWKDGRYGHGQILLVGDLILVMSEKGDVVLVEPDSEALKEVARLPVFADKTWNPPALAGQFLLVRNHVEAACYRLSLLK